MRKRLTLAALAALSLSTLAVVRAQQSTPPASTQTQPPAATQSSPAATTTTTTNASPATSSSAARSSGPVITAATSPSDMARAAVTAFGGAKYRNLKNITLRGTADLYSPNSTQALPAKFAMVNAGDRYRLEIDARPAFSFQQISDGQQSYVSMRGFELPPPHKFGLPLLFRFDQPGYTVSAIPDRRHQRGFRITDQEGNTTDYYVDPDTARVMSYETSYNGMKFGVEHKKFRDVEGILIPVSFTQKFDTGQGAFFADFNVHDVQLNQDIPDSIFAIPGN